MLVEEVRVPRGEGPLAADRVGVGRAAVTRAVLAAVAAAVADRAVDLAVKAVGAVRRQAGMAGRVMARRPAVAGGRKRLARDHGPGARAGVTQTAVAAGLSQPVVAGRAIGDRVPGRARWAVSGGTAAECEASAQGVPGPATGHLAAAVRVHRVGLVRARKVLIVPGAGGARQKTLASVRASPAAAGRIAGTRVMVRVAAVHQGGRAEPGPVRPAAVGVIGRPGETAHQAHGRRPGMASGPSTGAARAGMASGPSTGAARAGMASGPSTAVARAAAGSERDVRVRTPAAATVSTAPSRAWPFLPASPPISLIRRPARS